MPPLLGTWFAAKAGVPIRAVLRIVLFSCLVTLLANARPAAGACVSDGQGPCYRYWKADAVLLGQVTEKVLIKKDVWGNSYRLRVAVMEAFRGVGPGESSVTLGVYDGECGLEVNVGDQMLFYGFRRKDGTLGASSDSTPFEDADEGLAYARLARRNAATAMVYGSVVQREENPEDIDSFTSLSGVTVHVRGEDFDATSVTDEDGRYSVQLPDAGTYEIEVVSPEGLANRGPLPASFALRNAQDCFNVDFQLTTNGRIRGVVIDAATRRPVPNLVVSSEEHYQRSKTDRSGAFDIGPLSAGAYRLAAETGSEDPTRLMDDVAVASGRATVMRPLVVRFARPLTSVTFDLADLPGGGVIVIRPVSMYVEIGREDAVTLALEHGAELDIDWTTGEQTRTVKLTVDKNQRRVKLSKLTWRPRQ